MASKYQPMAVLFLFLASLTCHVSLCVARHSLVEELDDMQIGSVLERGVSCHKEPTQLADGDKLEATVKRSKLYGGQGGDKKDINSAENPPKKLISATIHYNNHAVTALSFEYRTQGQSGRKVTVGPWGDTRYATKYKTVHFDQDENVQELLGTYGDYNGHRIIKSLGFVTDHRAEIGPYGENTGFEFSFATSGSIVAFFANSGYYLDAIGAYYTTS